MSEDLEQALQAVDADDVSPAYVLWGEEFLVRSAAQALIAKLIPQQAVGLNLVTLDGVSPREIASELAMLPMFPGRKVVWAREPEFLAPKKGRADGLSKAKDAWRANRRKEGARRVLALIAKAGWGVQELESSAVDAWQEELGVVLAEADLAFLKEVAEFCRQEGISSAQGDDASLLELLEKGLPKGQVLLITATELDSKSALFKWVKQKGRVIEEKIAARLKDLDLTEFAAATLGPYQKKLGPSALDKLKDRVGGNMRLLQSELLKLAVYTVEPVITVRDVELLVGHAREEEFLELSDALQKRDFAAAKKYVDEALGQGAAPLLLLGSMASVVRNLLMGFERMAQLSQGKPPRNYRDFQDRIFPAIEEEAKASKTRVPHPYAAFMGMQAASAWGRAALLNGLKACAEADLALKFGGGELVLERLLWLFAGKAPPWESSMHTIRRELER